MSEAAPPIDPAVRRDRETAEIGTTLCKWLYAATKLGGLWGYEGKVSQEAIQSLVATLRESGALQGETVLRVASDQLFLNTQRLRMDFAGLTAFRYVVDLYASRQIGEIRFGSAPSEREVIALLKALNGVQKDSEDPRAEVERLLAAEGAGEIGVSPPRELDDAAEDRKIAGIRDSSVESYFRAVYVAKQLLRTGAGDAAVEVRKAKRAAHALVDLLERDEQTLLALVQVKNFGDYAATHGANTSVLAMAIARRVGVPRTLVGEIGVCAMLLDSGRPGDASMEEDATREERARRSARRLRTGMGFSDGALRLVIAARRQGDGAVRPDGSPAALTHRILRVASFYDTATTPAGPGRPPLTARKAVRAMARDPKRFDPKIVKVLASIVGRYPLGTVVRLDTGESAVVCGRNPHFESPARPIVRIVTDADGAEVAEPRKVDLSKWDREAKRFAHSIVESYAPSQAYSSAADYVKTV